VKHELKKFRLKYPYKLRWVIFSLLLFLFALISVALTLWSDVSALMVYMLLSLLLSCIFFVVKYNVYQRIDYAYRGGPFPVVERTEQDEGSKISIIILILLSIVGFLIPMVALFFLSPKMWIALIAGFVTGTSFPEVLLYLLSEK